MSEPTHLPQDMQMPHDITDIYSIKLDSDVCPGDSLHLHPELLSEVKVESEIIKIRACFSLGLVVIIKENLKY